MRYQNKVRRRRKIQILNVGSKFQDLDSHAAFDCGARKRYNVFRDYKKEHYEREKNFRWVKDLPPVSSSFSSMAKSQDAHESFAERGRVRRRCAADFHNTRSRIEHVAAAMVFNYMFAKEMWSRWSRRSTIEKYRAVSPDNCRWFFRQHQRLQREKGLILAWRLGIGVSGFFLRKKRILFYLPL